MVHINIAQKDINSLNDQNKNNSLSIAIDKILNLLSERGRSEAVDKGFLLEEDFVKNKNILILKVPDATEQLKKEMEKVYKEVALLHD